MHDNSDWVFAVLFVWIIGNLIWIITRPAKYPRPPGELSDWQKARAGCLSFRADLTALWDAYGRGRSRGLSRSDALGAATDEMQGHAADPAATAKAILAREKAERKPRDFIGFAQMLLVNSVTLAGVFELHWPLGTALALYWTENVLTGLTLSVRRAFSKDDGTPFSDVLLTTLVFNTAHFLFLLAFLGVMLPRMAPAEAFERTSFIQGLIAIAVLLSIDLFRTSSRDSVPGFIQRVVLLHLTIVIGMGVIALVGGVRAFFVVFAGLKLLADLSRRL